MRIVAEGGRLLKDAEALACMAQFVESVAEIFFEAEQLRSNKS